MTPDEIKAILVTMNDDAWHKQDLEAAYQIYSDDVVFERVPFPPVVGKELKLAEAPRAHRLLMESSAYGKIVLIP